MPSQGHHIGLETAERISFWVTQWASEPMSDLALHSGDLVGIAWDQTMQAYILTYCLRNGAGPASILAPIPQSGKKQSASKCAGEPVTHPGKIVDPGVPCQAAWHLMIRAWLTTVPVMPPENPAGPAVPPTLSPRNIASPGSALLSLCLVKRTTLTCQTLRRSSLHLQNPAGL